jgi:hypothetical protein
MPAPEEWLRQSPAEGIALVDDEHRLGSDVRVREAGKHIARGGLA